MSKTTVSSSRHRAIPVVSPGGTSAPWLQLRALVREALHERNFYVASSEDLALLWRDERVDALERRRRITVFAAQHQWRVDTREDGTAARFEVAPASGTREILSRNPE